MKLAKFLPLLVCSAALAWPRFAAAQDAFYQIPLSGLKFTEGTLPVTDNGWSSRHSWQLLPAMKSYVVLDGPGEAFVTGTRDMPWQADDRTPTLHIRAPQGAEVTGRLFVPQTNLNGMVQLKFKVAASEARPAAKDAFFIAKEEHYERLRDRNIPGAAWFRHQANEAAKGHGRVTNSESDFEAMGRRFNRRNSELEETYDLFTGGRALSENLQLDRALPLTRTNEETVAITNLPGISIAELNWKELIRDARPELDPLAAHIPADQHAIFFPSFQAMTMMIDEADANGTPVLQFLEPRAEDSDSRTRYQKQLCLEVSEISRLLGPQVVASVAFTGSDPFLRVGTDVAILFEARNADVLKTFIAARQTAAQVANAGVKPVQGNIDGIPFNSVVSPDRSVSSYMAAISNVVIVTNSKQQLETLVRVAKGGVARLSAQDEYLFFRQRYPRTDKSESAFIVLTDATIRRWCGPRWRIADSRRTRTAAVLSELQAAHLPELASGKATDAVLTAGYYLPYAGEFRLTRAGVASTTYGSLNFMTPISEIPLDQVTRAEADAYGRWRESYQRNWRQFFDPIAVRLSVAPDRLGAELTVMPLIAATDYREFIAFSSGAEIAPTAGDPHTNAMLHLVFAINTQSKPVQDAGNFLGNMAPGLKANTFGWLGQSIAIYTDADPFWQQLQQATNTDKFFEDNYPNLPLAIHGEVKNSLGLTAFLAALRAFVEQTAPGMTTWQNLDYKGQPYVQIKARSPGSDEKELAVYYAATSRSLVITLSEPMLKRALDRQAAGLGPDGKEQKPAAALTPWLGKSLCAAAGRQFFDILQLLTRDSYQPHLQLTAWNNLPILNEWKRLFPGTDPVKLHEQLWGVRLLCPGGGTYTWNENWQTMESTVFGHPGQPKTSPGKALSEILAAQLGVTFENQGLSAKAVLNRKARN